MCFAFTKRIKQNTALFIKIKIIFQDINEIKRNKSKMISINCELKINN